MSWFSWLTGESKSVEKAVDGVYNGLDMAFYTDEEKAIANHKILDFKIRHAEATKKESIARRVISFIVSGVWAVIVLMMVVAGYFDRGENSFSVYLKSVLVDVVNEPFGYIIMFYFAAHIVKGLSK